MPVGGARAGEGEQRQDPHVLMADVVDSLFLEPNPMGLKAAMSSMWGAVGDPRLPLIPVHGQTLHLIEVAVRKVLAQ